MLGNVEPEKEYSVYQALNFGTVPHEFATKPGEPVGLTWNIQHFNVRALPSLRTMTGSDRGLDLEYKIMKTSSARLTQTVSSMFLSTALMSKKGPPIPSITL